jgi:hypothetical protein
MPDLKALASKAATLRHLLCTAETRPSRDELLGHGNALLGQLDTALATYTLNAQVREVLIKTHDELRRRLLGEKWPEMAVRGRWAMLFRPGGPGDPFTVLLEQVEELATQEDTASVRREAEVWHFRYLKEKGSYTDRKCIPWLVKLLAAPGSKLTVADLRGDPEGKLAEDASQVATPKADHQAVKDALAELKGIADIRDGTGGSDALDEREAALRAYVDGDPAKKTLTSNLKRYHHNICSQLNDFLKALASDMPLLAAHLEAGISKNFPHFRYSPPNHPPDWKIST